MSDIELQLRQECEAIATNVLTNYDEADLISAKNIWSSDDRDKLAGRYYEIAMRDLEVFKRYRDDPAIVLRAVRYLGRGAIPPMRDDTGWFFHGLNILLELASPCDRFGPKGEPFFDDIRRGLAQAEQDENA